MEFPTEILTSLLRASHDWLDPGLSPISTRQTVAQTRKFASPINPLNTVRRALPDSNIIFRFLIGPSGIAIPARNPCRSDIMGGKSRSVNSSKLELAILPELFEGLERRK